MEKEELKKEINNIYWEIDKKNADIHNTKIELNGLKSKVKKLTKELENFEEHQKKEESKKCHKKIIDLLVEYGYKNIWGTKGQDVAMIGKIDLKDNFRTFLKVNFFNYVERKEVNLINDKCFIESIKNFMKEHNISIIDFNYDRHVDYSSGMPHVRTWLTYDEGETIEV